MESQKILITSYESPDLDGTACAFAYAELLEAQGKDVVYALFGTTHREAKFVFQTFNIIEPLDATDLISPETQIILVDASDTYGISSKINPSQVIEIIDHRKFNEAEKFANAKIQIELVGSAATLITEKFINSDITISPEAAALLYAAIISNTTNFQANVTTDRDKKASEWLLSKFTLPENFIHDMFVYKSNFTEPLEDILVADEAEFDIAHKKCIIFQLEIVEVENFIKGHLDEIQNILQKLKPERKCDYIFLSIIDIENAINTVIAADHDTEKLVEQALNIQFKHGIANTKNIMMRKTISPLIKDILERT